MTYRLCAGVVAVSVVSAAFADRGAEMAVSGIQAAKLYSDAWSEDTKRAVTAGHIPGDRPLFGVPDDLQAGLVNTGALPSPALCACIMPEATRRSV